MKQKLDLSRFRLATEADIFEANGEHRLGRIVWHLSIKGLQRYKIVSAEDAELYQFLMTKQILYVERIWQQHQTGWASISQKLIANGMGTDTDLTDEKGNRILLVNDDPWQRIKDGFRLNYNGKWYVIFDRDAPQIEVKQLRLF